MQTFCIPFIRTEKGIAEIEAKNLEEAIELLQDGSFIEEPEIDYGRIERDVTREVSVT